MATRNLLLNSMACLFADLSYAHERNKDPKHSDDVLSEAQNMVNACREHADSVLRSLILRNLVHSYVELSPLHGVAELERRVRLDHSAQQGNFRRS